MREMDAHPAANLWPRQVTAQSWPRERERILHGVQKILGKYGPSAQRDFLAGGGYKIDYLPYNWGLNDQGGRGKDYTRGKLLLDKITGGFR